MKNTFAQCLIEANKIRGAKEWSPELDNLTEDSIEAIVSKVQIEMDLVLEGEVKTTPKTMERATLFVEKWEAIATEQAAEIAEQAAQESATKESEENNGLKIVDEFLALWKVEAMKYYTNLREELIVERRKEYEITPEGLALIPKTAWGGQMYDEAKIEEIMNELPTMDSRRVKRLKSDIGFRRFNAWKALHSKVELAIVESMYGKDKGVAMLNEFLDKDVVRKKAALISRVEKYAGTIVNAKGLRIGVNGEINGYVVGETKTVLVNTIYAGGYNIQCLHYRVLVK